MGFTKSSIISAALLASQATASLQPIVMKVLSYHSPKFYLC